MFDAVPVTTVLVDLFTVSQKRDMGGLHSHTDCTYSIAHTPLQPLCPQTESLE